LKRGNRAILFSQFVLCIAFSLYMAAHTFSLLSSRRGFVTSRVSDLFFPVLPVTKLARLGQCRQLEDLAAMDGSLQAGGFRSSIVTNQMLQPKSFFPLGCFATGLKVLPFQDSPHCGPWFHFSSLGRLREEGLPNAFFSISRFSFAPHPFSCTCAYGGFFHPVKLVLWRLPSQRQYL